MHHFLGSGALLLSQKKENLICTCVMVMGSIVKGPSIKNVRTQSIGGIINGGKIATYVSMKMWGH